MTWNCPCLNYIIKSCDDSSYQHLFMRCFSKVLHPLLYGIICFLVFLVVILLILLFKIITSMQRGECITVLLLITYLFLNIIVNDKWFIIIITSFLMNNMKLYLICVWFFCSNSGLRRDHVTSETGESTALSPNNVLSVSPLSGDGKNMFYN